jgi:hypothetical protein
MSSAVHRREALAALLLLAAHACTRDVGLLSPPDGGSPVDRTPEIDQRPAGGATGSAGATGAGGAGGATPSSLCSGGFVRFAGTSSCSGTLAARSHRYALCSCGDWTVSNPFYTDVFSSNLSIVTGPAPAAVGVNGKISATAGLSIRGSLYASGEGGISEATVLDVGKTLHSAGPVVVAPMGTGTVTGDAYIGDDVMGSLRIGGTLHLAPYATMGQGTTAAMTTREAVTVTDPCDCSVPFDVGGTIVALSSTNDNAANNWNPDRLNTPNGMTTVDVPCGSFFLNTINSQALINLAVHGRALIAVGGDVSLSGGMTVKMDAGAELDMLILGGITSSGMVPVGAYQAASFRVWMAGASPLTFTGHPNIGGIFEAPLANVSAPDGMEVEGSIVAASITLGDQVTVHFDQAVLSSGVECGDPLLDPIP